MSDATPRNIQRIPGIWQPLPVRNVCCMYIIILPRKVSSCSTSTKISLFQFGCCIVTHKKGPQASRKSKQLVERDWDKIGRAILEVQWGATDVRGCIQQHKPAAWVVTCWVETSPLDTFHIVKRILPPRKVALGWIAEEVWCLANIIITLCLIFCPVFHSLRGDGQSNYSLGERFSSYANYRSMIVCEVREVTPFFNVARWSPWKALSHYFESSCTTRSENHSVLLRGGVKMLQ